MKKNIKLVRIIIAAVIFIAGLVLGINGYSKRMSDSYADAKSVIKAYKENADSVSAGALKTAEATIQGTSVFEYDKNGTVAKAYENLVKEVLQDERFKEKNEPCFTR